MSGATGNARAEFADPVLAAAAAWARDAHAGDASGHDWWHVLRVARMARRLAAEERANEFICVLAALLHDVADEKLNPSEAAGLERVRAWLAGQPLHDVDAEHVLEIIRTMSFKGGGGKPMRTPEGAIVRDADRLDAIGAQGIARVFAYSGSRGQAIHDPDLPPRELLTREQYRNERSTAINHFHEKLLKLKDLMTTPTARRLAEERHRFMEEFLRKFQAEWEGEE